MTLRNHILICFAVSLLAACSGVPLGTWGKRQVDLRNKAVDQPETLVNKLNISHDRDEKAYQRIFDEVSRQQGAANMRELRRNLCIERAKEGIYVDLKQPLVPTITYGNEKRKNLGTGVLREQYITQSNEAPEGRLTIRFGSSSSKDAEYSKPEDRIATYFDATFEYKNKNTKKGNKPLEYANLVIGDNDFVVFRDGAEAGPEWLVIGKHAWVGKNIWRTDDIIQLDLSRDDAQCDEQEIATRLQGGEENGFRVKYLNKPVLAIIDELAYKRRFSYTIVSDLSPFTVDIYDESSLEGKGIAVPKPSQVKQRFFRDERELLEYVVSSVNKKYFRRYERSDKRLAYSWESDGPTLFIETREGQKECTFERSDDGKVLDGKSCPGFKKIFFNNIPVTDATTIISNLFLVGDSSGSLNDQNKMNMTMTEYKFQNALLLRSSKPELLQQIGSMIYAYDAESPQILIEAFVYQYTEQVSRTIGTALEITRSQLLDNTEKTLRLKTLLGTEITDALPTVFFGMNDADKRRSLLATLAAQDKEGLVKIVAEPKLISKSGADRASIKLTTKKTIQLQGTNFADARDLEAGLELAITPVILGGDNVLLAVELTQSEFVPSAEAQVLQTTNINQINVNLVVKDGELTSLGAVESTKSTDMGSGIAGLKDVGVRNNPLFGLSDRANNSLKVEFMVRPHIRFMDQKAENMRNIHFVRKLTTE